MAYVDGFTAFLATWTGVSTAYKLNTIDTGDNFGDDAGADYTPSGFASQTGFPNDALNNQDDPPAGTDFDSYIVTDSCMLVYLPSGLSEDDVYGLYSNGGGTNGQCGILRITAAGIEICALHNNGGTDQDSAIYEVTDLDRWYMVGFQFEDNSGNINVWVDGVEEASSARNFALAWGSGNPDLGNSAADEPGGWGQAGSINGSGILLGQFVIDNPNEDNSAPAANGDSFYTDYYAAHFDGGETVAKELADSFTYTDQNLRDLDIMRGRR